MKRFISIVLLIILIGSPALAPAATSITTRASKGSALTHAELDANFNNLKTTADGAVPAAGDITCQAGANGYRFRHRYSNAGSSSVPVQNPLVTTEYSVVPNTNRAGIWVENYLSSNWGTCLSFKVTSVVAGGTTLIEVARATQLGNFIVASADDDGVNKVQVAGSVVASQYKLRALGTAPTSASATGTLGEIRIDANYIYFCVATNTWKRSALSTW